MTTPLPPMGIRLLATAGGAGFVPRAPGTAGSLVGLALAAAFHTAPISKEVELASAVVLAICGTWGSGKWGQTVGKADDGRIVIDEVSGQWIASSCIGTALNAHNAALYAASFVLFRLFDIWKPWPIRALDRRSKKLRGVWLQGLGVMADDWLAGLIALAFVSGLALA